MGSKQFLREVSKYVSRADWDSVGYAQPKKDVEVVKLEDAFKALDSQAKQFLGWLVSKERLIGRNWTPRQFELFGVLQREFKKEFL